MRKYTAFFLMFLLVFTSVMPGVVLADDDQPPVVIVPIPSGVDSSQLVPRLNVSNKELPIGKAGEIVSIPLTIKNNSAYAAKDIVIKPEFDEDGKRYFTTLNLNFSASIPVLYAEKSADVVLEFKISMDAEEKIYPITLKYEYTTFGGQSLTSSEIIYLKVENNNREPNVIVEKIDFDPKAIVPGEGIKVGLHLGNLGTLPAYDVTVSLEGLRGDGFTISGDTNSKYVEKIDGTKKTVVFFQLSASKDIQRGNHGLTAKIEYKDHKGQSQSRDYQFFMPVLWEEEKMPEVLLQNIKAPEGGVQSQEDFKVSFELINVGQGASRNIKVTVLPDEAIVPKSPSIKTVSLLEPGKSAKMEFMFALTSEALTKSYSLAIQVEYFDETGKQESKQVFTQYIGIWAENKRSSLEIQNISLPAGEVDADEEFKVVFDLKNTGQGTARNIKVSLTSDQAIVPKSPSIKTLQALEAGKSQKFEFVFSATSEAVSKNYPIAINIEYEDNGETKTITQYTGVNVKGGSESSTGGKSVPKIIIDDYKSEPTIVRAGENFNLKISFQNTHREKAIQNIKIFLTVDVESTAAGTGSGSVFTPVNSSNTFYIDYIGPRESVQKELLFYTIPDAQPKTYTVTANFEYEDEEGNQYTATELFGIPVVQQTRLETSELSLPPEGYVGQPISLFLEFYNMGKVRLYNLMVKTEGDFTLQNPNYFVGNFEPGSSDYYEVMLIPNMPGEAKGSIVFTYDDAAGESHEVRKDFTINVMEMVMPDFPPDMNGGMKPEMPLQESGIMKYLKSPYVWAGAGVVLALIVFIILRKRHIRKKGMTFDE